MPKLTPTEAAILELLSDGLAHTREEVHSCLPDELTPPSGIKAHLSNLRKKLPRGETILCQFRDRRFYYRHVRLISNAGDGRS